MAKFCGNIGFMTNVEVEPGIWDLQIEEHKYYGDITRNMTSSQNTTDKIHDSISLNNIIEIVADPYANNNFQNIKYIVFNGIKWEVLSAEVKFPRILLSIGGIYNEQSSNPSD